MKFLHLISVFFSIFLISSPPPYLVQAQQPYVGRATTNCGNRDVSNSVLGYTCNGVNQTCQAYLTFRSQTPYNSVPTISNLLGTDPSQLAQLNAVSENAAFGTDVAVLVPVQCSCSGQYYQANTSYVVQNGDTPFIIANNTFQGLSTCQAIDTQRSSLTVDIYTGSRIAVPLRCACPTRNQTNVDVNYLLSYLVTWGQTVSAISAMFGVDTGRTLEANGLSEQNANIYPFTTLLVPLQNPPSSSQTLAPPPPRLTSPPPPSSPGPSSNRSSNKTWVYVVVGVIGGIALTLVIGFIVFCLFFQKRKKETLPLIASQSFETIEKPNEKKLEEDAEFFDSLSSIAQSLKIYKFEELKSATDNFSPSCWIRGSVYRGTINGDFAAIKKTEGDVSKEINLLNKINHHNIIRLSGLCFRDGHWYLVYEYAANGTLSDWIYHGDNVQKSLNWMQRVQVALDVATGLNYLHSYTSPPYVFKDVKSSNILLDSDFRAKITNFDLARSAEGEEGQFALTRHIVGTKGYMSPEYLENGLISTKLDVYAFGVLMLELLTGRQVAALYEGLGTELSDVIAPVLQEEDGKENLSIFMDPNLQGKYPPELAIYMARLINNCIRKDPSDRPDMNEMVQHLSRTMTSSLSWEVSKSFAGYQSQH